jgi:hypothetical protein
MANRQEHGSKSQAIRDYLTENPGAHISHVVEALAARGIQVSPPLVVVVRSQLESNADDAPEAENVTISVSFPEDQRPLPRKKRASGVAAEVKSVTPLPRHRRGRGFLERRGLPNWREKA